MIVHTYHDVTIKLEGGEHELNRSIARADGDARRPNGGYENIRAKTAEAQLKGYLVIRKGDKSTILDITLQLNAGGTGAEPPAKNQQFLF